MERLALSKTPLPSNSRIIDLPMVAKSESLTHRMRRHPLQCATALARARGCGPTKSEQRCKREHHPSKRVGAQCEGPATQPAIGPELWTSSIGLLVEFRARTATDRQTPSLERQVSGELPLDRDSGLPRAPPRPASYKELLLRRTQVSFAPRCLAQSAFQVKCAFCGAGCGTMCGIGIGAHLRNSDGQDTYHDRRIAFCCCGGSKSCRQVAPGAVTRRRLDQNWSMLANLNQTSTNVG